MCIPVPYQADDVRVRYRAELARIALETELGYTRYRLQRVSVNSLDAGAGLGNRDVASNSLTTSYVFDLARRPVAVLRGSHSDFATAAAAQLCNNTGIIALTRFDFVASRPFCYRVLVGYT